MTTPTAARPPRGRPRIAALALGMVLALGLGACGAIEPDGGELVLLIGADATGNSLQRLLTMWADRHHDSPVRVVELSPVADQQHEALVKDAQDDSSTSDLYGLDVTWVAEFAANDYVRPLDDFDAAPFLPAPYRTGLYPPGPDHGPSVEGTLYAAPYTTNAGLLFYRRDLVPTAPTSWDALATLAPTVQGRGPAALYAGQLDDYEGLTVNVLEALGQVAPGRTLFQAGLPALQEAVRLLRPGPVVLPESLTFNEDTSTQAMRDGKVALLRNWPVYDRALATTTSEGPDRAGLFGAAQIPGGFPVLGGQDMAVSSHSRHPAQARALIDFLTGPEAQHILLEAGAPATRGDAYVTPGAPAPAPDSVAAALPQALGHAVPRPAGICYAQFSALLHRAVHESLSTGADLPADLLGQLGDALDCRPVSPATGSPAGRR